MTTPLVITNPRILSFFDGAARTPEEFILEWIDFTERISAAPTQDPNTIFRVITDNINTRLASIKDEYLAAVGPAMERQHDALANKLTLLFGELPTQNKELFHSIEKQLIQLKHETDFSRAEKVWNSMTATIMSKLSFFDTQITTITKSQADLNDYFNKLQNNSSSKGRVGENRLAAILTQLYPAAELTNTAGRRAAADFHLARAAAPDIVFENKEYSNNVPREEVVKFLRDIGEVKCHGIFLSQYSGIANKENYQIEIHDGNILVYVHNVEYCAEKVKIAVDIIDHLAAKLGTAAHEITISADQMAELYSEMQSFATNKAKLIQSITENHKRTLSQLADMKMPALDRILAAKFAGAAAAPVAAEDSAPLTCPICNKYQTTVRRNLAAHQKRCPAARPTAAET